MQWTKKQMQTRKWKLQLNEQIQCNYFQTPPVAHLAKGTTIKLFPYIYHLKLGLLNPRGKTWAGQMETRSWPQPGASDFPLTCLFCVWNLMKSLDSYKIPIQLFRKICRAFSKDQFQRTSSLHLQMCGWSECWALGQSGNV